MVEAKNKLKYRLLEEHAIDFNDNTDLLNSTIYVDLLEETVEEAANKNGVETIGLVGGWGSGKSSILESYKNRIQGRKINGKNVRIQTFNAWKYAKDDFRKSFLLDVEESKTERKKLEKDIYHQITMPKYSLLKLEPKELKTLLFVVGAILIAMILVWAIKGIDSVADGINLIFSCVGVTISGFAITLIKSLIVEDRVTVIKAFTTVEFSNKFSDIVKKSKKFNIFIIDDLDRCKSEQALDILEIVHSYLKSSDKNNYLFIIPIDKNRIEKFLINDRKYDNDDVEQYFAKIFDYEICMSKPGSRNLYDMTDEINQKNNFGLSSMSISLLSDYLINTPRDIKKHFNNINMLRMENIKISAINGSNRIDDDEIVKLYILKQLWPEIYNTLLEKSNSKINTDDALEEQRKENKDDYILNNFVYMSNSISVNKIVEFEYLNDYRSKIKIELLNNILYNKVQCIENEINEGIFSVEEVSEHIIYLYKTYIVNRRQYKIVDGLLNIYCLLVLKFGYNETKLTGEIYFNSLIQPLKQRISSIFSLGVNEETTKKAYEVINTFEENILHFAKKYCDKRNVNVGINELAKLLNRYNLAIVTLKLLQIDCLYDNTILNNNIRNEILKSAVLLSGCDYDALLKFCINDNTKQILDDDEMINKLIQDNATESILELLKSGVVFNGEQYEGVVSNLNFNETIKYSINDLTEQEITEFNEELCYINNIIEIAGEHVVSEIIDNCFINFNYIIKFCESIISTEHDEINELVLSNIVKLIAYVDNYNENAVFAYTLVNDIGLDNAYEKCLYSAIDYYENSVKDQLIISFMCIDDYSERMSNLYFASNINTTDKELFEDATIESIKTQRNQSLNYEHIGNLAINYEGVKEKFIKHIYKLPKEKYVELLTTINLDFILNNENFMLVIKEGDSEYKDIIVQRIKTIEQCEKVLNYIEFKECIKEYHKIIIELIEAATSVTSLLKIHNFTTDQYVLDHIKKSMNEKFPDGDRSGFTKIGWEQDI